jgi:glycosyltransferase involved in cell wall biosynthesis
MLLSIVTLSYNRPEQIERILKNLIKSDPGDYNLIIKDDCSPRQSEIEKVVESYANKVKFEIIFHKNITNLGYDRNLLDAFNIIDSDYIFLLSDDDYIDGEYLSCLCDLLSRREYKLYFTPYEHYGSRNRVKLNSFDLVRFHEVIYNSILFSGLIFCRGSVLRLVKDESFLSNCIYTQVYLAAVLVFNEKKFGEAPVNLLYLGGDGENYFGKNQSSSNQEQLRDRISITANLMYQKLLIEVVREISRVTSPLIFINFKKEYDKRFVAYLFRARTLGLSDFFALKNGIKKTNYKYTWIVNFFMFVLPMVPGFMAGAIYDYLKLKLKKSG